MFFSPGNIIELQDLFKSAFSPW